MRSRRVFLRTRKSPRRLLSQMRTKPKNLKVSGLERARFLRFCAVKRPNSISRVLSGCSDNENSASLSRIFDHAGPDEDSHGAFARVAFRAHESVGARVDEIFVAQWLVHAPPADASPSPSRTPTNGSGPMWIATPFIAADLHRLLLVSFCRRTESLSLSPFCLSRSQIFSLALHGSTDMFS